MYRNDYRNFNFSCPTILFGGSFLCACLIPSCVGVLSWLLSLASTVLLFVSWRLIVPSCLFPLASFLWPSASCVLALASFLFPVVSCLLCLSSFLLPTLISVFCVCVIHTPNMIPHVPFHLRNLRPMPKVRQTLLQVQERQRREQRLRTEARCAQLEAQAKSRVTVRDNLEEISDDEDNTSIEQHGKVHHLERREIRLRTEGRGGPLVAEGKLIVTVLVNHQVISDDEDIVHIEQDGNVPQRFKGWKPSIDDLICGFLLLLAANCVVLLYFFFYKANSV